MKKILFVTGPMAGHGGEESVLSTVIDELTDRYAISLLLSEQSGDTDWLSSVKQKLTGLVVMPKGQSRYLKAFKTILAIRRIQPDIVIALTPRMVYLASVAMLGRRVRILSWLHFAPNSKFSPQTRQLLRKADTNLVLTEAMKQQLLEDGLPENQIEVVYNPVAPTDVTIKPSQFGTPVQFICMARIQYAGQKNLQELFHGLSGVEGAWQLHLYGNDDSIDKIETKKCKKLLSELGLTHRVQWHGFVQDAWSTIKHADCIVLTSTIEGLPMVLCEAASRGLPMISSDCETGPAEIINADNGYLYQLGHIDQLRKALQTFVDRKNSFDAGQVKASIGQFYMPTYVKRLTSILH